MKTLFTLLISITSFSAFAGGGALGHEDVIVSMTIIGFLVLLLGFVYLFDFINKIRKDKNYRDHLKARVVNLISTVRTIFHRKKESEEENIDFSVAIAR